MKKILVTGGCGYIGSHVARAFKLADPGNQVTVVDRVIREHTLKGIDGWIESDFIGIPSLSHIINDPPDVIVHCAGTSLVGPSMTNPAEYYDNNVVKTLQLLNILKDLPKKPLILFSSSASVYGEPNSLPIKEDDALRPMSPYGSTKLTVERILNDYGNAYGIDSVCFRFFNAAGAEPFKYDLGQEPDATHIVARVLEASIAGRAFTINGGDFDTLDGTCIRDYIHVWDLATAHVQAVKYIDAAGDDRTAVTEVFNLGTNSGTSNKQIVDYVKEKYGLPFVNYGEKRWGDPAELVAECKRANEVLNWRPMFSDIGTIIDSAYKWYKHGL